MINKENAFPIISSARSLSPLPLAIEHSGDPPIPNKFAKAIIIEIKGKHNPRPLIANEATSGNLPI